MVTQRHIVIGDIHGAYEELMALLDACERTPADEVVCVGDLVDRGPDPTGVVRFFMEDGNAISLLGNHEDKHLRIRSGELGPGAGQTITRIQMGGFYEKALEYFATLPLWLRRAGHFICHAGVVPGVPLDQQPKKALVRGKMPWMKDIFDTSGPMWWDEYTGDTPIIYGHLVSKGEVRRRPNSWGMDTGGCHAGGTLSALILPEGRVVSVPSKGNSFSSLLDTHKEEVARAREAFRTAQRKRKTASRPAKEAPREQVLELSGTKIDGTWVLSVVDRPPGAWVGKALREIRARVAQGSLQSLEEAEQWLPTLLGETAGLKSDR